MNPLRQRMIEDMRVRNLAPKTQISYSQQITAFARHFQRSPERLGPEEIRTSQVYLIDSKQLSSSSLTVATAALRFIYKTTLGQTWAVDRIPFPKAPQKPLLPTASGTPLRPICWKRAPTCERSSCCWATAACLRPRAISKSRLRPSALSPARWTGCGPLSRHNFIAPKPLPCRSKSPISFADTALPTGSPTHSPPRNNESCATLNSAAPLPWADMWKLATPATHFLQLLPEPSLSQVPESGARQMAPRRQAELLPIPYFHVVFTLPEQIAAIAFQNKREVYGILFQAASETLRLIAADPPTPRRPDRLDRHPPYLGPESITLICIASSAPSQALPFNPHSDSAVCPIDL